MCMLVRKANGLWYSLPKVEIVGVCGQVDYPPKYLSAKERKKTSFLVLGRKKGKIKEEKRDKEKGGHHYDV